MNSRGVVLCAALLPVVSIAGGSGKAFDRLTSRLSSAACVELQFVSIIASDVFKSVDSAEGTAVLARDGRYKIHIGSDEYLFDGGFLYSYSAENNQVTVEATDSTNGTSESVAFLTRLDDWYDSHILQPGRKYRLVKRAEAPDGALPDSMRITIDAEQNRLVRVVYFDINDDLHEVAISRQILSDSCREELFLPDWPDSVETVKLF